MRKPLRSLASSGIIRREVFVRRCAPMIASACLAVLAGSPSALTGQGVPVPAKTRSAEKTQGTELKKDSEKTKSRASPNSAREIEKIRSEEHTSELQSLRHLVC